MSDPNVMQGRAMRWVYRTLPVMSSLVVAAASFALSFVALRDVAAEKDAVPDAMAWLVPIVIDGGVMCASAVIWAAAAQNQKRQIFPFFVVVVLVALSVVVNAAHAGPSLLAKTIAALPPLVLLATLELVAIATKRYEELATEPEPEPVVASAQNAPAKKAPAKKPARKTPAKKAAAKKASKKPATRTAAAKETTSTPATAVAAVEQGTDEQETPDAATTLRRPTRVRALEPEEA